jgi:hypothetical protein
LKHLITILDRCNFPPSGESPYRCELTIGHAGQHEITEDGHSYKYGPSNPPMVPRQSREKRLEMLLTSARDVIIEQRTALLRSEARLARALEVLRYVKNVYKSPLVAEAIREIEKMP